MHILLIEDDEFLGDGVRKGLDHMGHNVDWLKDGQLASQILKNAGTKGETFDLIILDLGLPKKSGLELLKEIRDRKDSTPVLILTARDSIEDRVRGLDTGADDYLAKPFDLDELAARIRALNRRNVSRVTPMIEYKTVSMDPAAHIVTVEGKPVPLLRKEFALLQKLLENPNHVLSRELLTQTLYGWEEDIDSNVLEVHIHNLRKKLNIDFIRTIRGIGYMVEKTE